MAGNAEVLTAHKISRSYGATSTWGRSKSEVKAVQDVSFKVLAGKTLGIVGESGSGKSTLARCVAGLDRPTSGNVKFNGIDIHKLCGYEARRLRRRIQFVFQDPYSSLNPRKTIRQILADPFEIHRLYDGQERKRRINELMERVGLRSEYLDRYPHQFSGGQRQRISIARALALGPELIIADEPVSALDVSIQAQIINLLVKLQDDFNLTYVFVSHDMRVVRYFCDDVIVMLKGNVVEAGPVEVVFGNPRHDYTRELLGATPVLSRKLR